MKVKLHLTGYAVAYEPLRFRKSLEPSVKTGRPQGSLISYQKHLIADAVEWIRLNCTYKPRIFVATTPGYLQTPPGAISKLCHNLKNGYGMKEFVWVRELTKKGFAHWHFVADVDKFDPVQLSLYWSSIFKSDAKNSIRLGTKPDRNGVRRYWVNTQKMSWYLTKYLGKGLGTTEKKNYRTFHVSKIARRESQPLVYEAELHHTYRNTLERTFVLSEDCYHFAVDGIPHTFNPHGHAWKWTGHGQTYSGFPRKTGTKSQ